MVKNFVLPKLQNWPNRSGQKLTLNVKLQKVS